MKMIMFRFRVLVSIGVTACQLTFAQSSHSLWYTRPAEHFEESLVLGNGQTGASVFGGVASDKIYLNDATLWSGEPVDPHMNPEAHRFVPAIREALADENYPLADSLNKHLQGSFSESFAPMGTLFLDFNHAGIPKDYHRQLDLREGVALTRYEVDGVAYQREYFISHPDRVMVIRVTSDKKRALHFSMRFESLCRYETSVEQGTFKVTGFAPAHAEPSYRGDMPNAVVFDPAHGTRFSGFITVNNTHGKVSVTDEGVSINGASDATVIISFATSFNGFDKHPVTEGVDEARMAFERLQAANRRTFEELKRAHLKDYQSFFKRVELDLGATTAPDLPTDERLKRYAEGKEDKHLEILYFQYGRYLLISSSRVDGVPANLQGIWNPYIRPPWSSNYTININLEENYWLAENANLSEMHRPLLTFIGNIAATGKVTAAEFYGVGGWAACHNSDIWAMSNPVGDFGKGDPVWANWNMGGAWLSTHLWEHFDFTRDLAFLKDHAYPLMKGAAQFCLEWLVEDQRGKLITSPSTSPENLYVTPDGYRGATLYGATADLAIIRELFLQCILATETLNTDEDFRARLRVALDRLHPYSVGAKGHLQEWYHDWEDADPRHRHQSHLFGLYPGHHLSPRATPALADACRRTLEIKGDETTGWSKGWRINLWARLGDGNRTYKMFRELLRYVPPDGEKLNYRGGGGTYPNLFDAHPPFQIDGNFGGAAAVVEMLVQSGGGEIRLLPALPDAWANGSVKGICARGGFEIDMTWENKAPKELRIYSRRGGKARVAFGDKHRDVALAAGESIAVSW